MAAPKGNKFAEGKGAPSKYKQEYDEQAYKLCLLGAIDQEIADFFEVDVDTIYEWKKVHESFSDSIKRGKKLADGNIASRLYQRAYGYEHEGEEIKVVSMGTGMGSEIERVPIKVVYPPDTTAAIFWLKNRQPKLWRDKQETDITTNGKDVNQVTIFELPNNNRDTPTE
jgi:hypothetical protein